MARTSSILVALACASGCYRGADARATADDATQGDAGTEDGTASDGGASDGDDDSDPLISECRRPTYEVFERLAPTCAGCHDEGTSVPLAADFVSFEQLVVYNTDLIAFGRPDDSLLLDMLEGIAAPPLEQMPPGAASWTSSARPTSVWTSSRVGSKSSSRATCPAAVNRRGSLDAWRWSRSTPR